MRATTLALLCVAIALCAVTAPQLVGARRIVHRAADGLHMRHAAATVAGHQARAAVDADVDADADADADADVDADASADADANRAEVAVAFDMKEFAKIALDRTQSWPALMDSLLTDYKSAAAFGGTAANPTSHPTTFTADANAALRAFYTDGKSAAGAAGPTLHISAHGVRPPKSYRWATAFQPAGVEFAAKYDADTRRRGAKNSFSASGEWEEAAKEWVKRVGRPGDQAGHVLPNAFGGTMFPANIWPQSPNTNVGSGIAGWKEAETLFTKMARGTYKSRAAGLVGSKLPLCINTDVRVRFYFDDPDYPLRPTHGYYHVAATPAPRVRAKCQSGVFVFLNVPCLPTGAWLTPSIWNAFAAMKARLEATYGAEVVAHGQDLGIVPVAVDLPDPAPRDDVDDSAEAKVEVNVLTDEQFSVFRAMAAAALRQAGLPTDDALASNALKAAFGKCPAAEHAFAQVMHFVKFAHNVERRRIEGLCATDAAPVPCANTLLATAVKAAAAKAGEVLSKAGTPRPTPNEVDAAFEDFIEGGEKEQLAQLHYAQLLLIHQRAAAACKPN